MKPFQKLKKNILNIPGWRTNRHIVVMESDDWGSIRMPSKHVFNKLLKAGIRVDRCHYCSNDSIASENDLSLLFEVLNSVKDINNKPAVITANAVVANPDFIKIKDDNFDRYYYSKITKELPNIKGCEKSLELWREGHKKGFFIIQSHGREHLNVNRWMYYLKIKSQETRFAFDHGVYGLSTSITSEKRKSFLPAFDFETIQEEDTVNLIAKDGLKLFEEIFGYKSKSFIAPNYTWGKSLELNISEYGVKYIQGQQIAKYKNSLYENNKKRIRIIGRKNYIGQIDLSRNVFFEPSENQNIDWVNSCMAEIECAFRWHHPAIISTHRVNFVGTINIKNRDQNLKLLMQLLYRIKQKWSDVEFISSDQLGDIISKQYG